MERSNISAKVCPHQYDESIKWLLVQLITEYALSYEEERGYTKNSIAIKKFLIRRLRILSISNLNNMAFKLREYFQNRKEESGLISEESEETKNLMQWIDPIFVPEEMNEHILYKLAQYVEKRKHCFQNLLYVWQGSSDFYIVH